MALGNLADIADLLAAAGVIASLNLRRIPGQADTDGGSRGHCAGKNGPWRALDFVEIHVGHFRSPGQVTRSGRSAQRSGKIQTEKFFLGTRPALPEFVCQWQQGLLDEYFSYGIARTATYWIKNYLWAATEWKNAQQSMPPEFAQFINTELEQHPEKYVA